MHTEVHVHVQRHYSSVPLFGCHPCLVVKRSCQVSHLQGISLGASEPSTCWVQKRLVICVAISLNLTRLPLFLPPQPAACTALPSSYAHTIPANLDLAGVAPLLCAGITTFSPYKDHGFDQPGKKVGVVGLGGLGHMAVKFGVAFGCEVYVISRNRNKEDQAKATGAKAVIPSGDPEAVKGAEGEHSLL